MRLLDDLRALCESASVGVKHAIANKMSLTDTEVVLVSRLREIIARHEPQAAKSFEAAWKCAPIPGEYDTMDETDKARWRGVALFIWTAALESRPTSAPSESWPQTTIDRVLGRGESHE